MSQPAEYVRHENASSSGGYEFDDKEVKEQRKAIMQFVKKVGLNLFEIKDLIRTSLPVTIFEPRSYLERINDAFGLAPVFLRQAAEATDALERFKLVIAFSLSGMHMTCRQLKPFNPILGETYQATYSDGTEIYAEQASHHPPVTAWELIGPNKLFHFSGHGEWHAAFRGNSIKGQQHGVCRIQFHDGGVIEYNFPECWIRGIVMGSRMMEYLGKIEFFDRKNGLFAEVNFNPDTGFFKWIKGTKTPSDFFRGEIFKYTDGVERKENKVVLHTLNGTWLGGLDIDDVRYWDIRQMSFDQASKCVPVERPLPSDCRYRQDLVHLLNKDLEGSSVWKNKLEELQRYDKKLRTEHEKNAKKTK